LVGSFVRNYCGDVLGCSRHADFGLTIAKKIPRRPEKRGNTRTYSVLSDRCTKSVIAVSSQSTISPQIIRPTDVPFRKCCAIQVTVPGRPIVNVTKYRTRRRRTASDAEAAAVFRRPVEPTDAHTYRRRSG